MKRDGASLDVFETHAGAGVYDLAGEQAQKSREAETGVLRLMQDDGEPAAFNALKAAVRGENPLGPVSLYPGSPALMLGALGKGDRYTGCELRPDDHAALKALLEKRRRNTGPEARAIFQDGYEFLGEQPRRNDGQILVLVDPPFERGDEYDRVVQAARHALDRGNALAIWTPIKDFETLDSLVSRIEALRPARMLTVQVRLRPLNDPTRMNGCAMILADTPDVRREASDMADWVVTRCGESGGSAKIEALGSWA